MTKIKNIRPGILIIADAKLRLRPGQTAEVATVTKQVERLIASGHLAVVAVPQTAAPQTTGEATGQTNDSADLLAQPLTATGETSRGDDAKDQGEASKKRSLGALERKLKEATGGAE